MHINEKIQLFRDRFRGRQDVYGKEWISYREGKRIKGFSPACENFNTPGCHIRLKDGTPCSQCEPALKKYKALPDEAIRDHIQGVSSMLNYLLQEDGTVHFAAIDFDLKPGKEHLGHKLEDVMKVSGLLSEIGLPHAIARSTGLGHHLYVFFSEAVDANKIRSLFYWAFEKVGFIAEVKAAVRPLPEIFPKQVNSEGGLGNGIKPPLIEPNFAEGRNCFITERDQWEYLKDIPSVSTTQLDEIITKLKIEVQEETKEKPYGAKSAWTPPTVGAISRVLNGCMAFRKIRDRCAAGEVLGHDEGFALWHMCINVADGEEWFLKNVPGWGKTEAQLKQLQQSKDRNYKPWSCTIMQDKGVCIKGTKCFDKKPPMIVENGIVKEDKSIPESEWPSPSPYRYAVNKNEIYLAQLLERIDQIVKDVPELAVRRSLIKELTPNVMPLDELQQNVYQEKIQEGGSFKPSQAKKIMAEAKKEYSSKVQEDLSSRCDNISAGGILYKRTVNPYGYEKIKGIANESDIMIPFTNFVLDIEEERVYVENDMTCRWYVGHFKSEDASIKFEIEANVWSNTQQFDAYFTNLCGSRWVVSRKDLDELRLVAIASAGKEMPGKNKIKQTQYCSAPGWHGNSYLMPSVIIEGDTIKPNTDMPVNTLNKEHAKYLDFGLVNNKELPIKNLLWHVEEHLIPAFPYSCVTHAIGFSLMASVIRYLNLDYTPTLWFEGESGSGKTALCMLMQKFYGDFKGPLNWGTTYSSMITYGYEFKDCLLLVDDFKEYGGTSFKVQICQQIVQNAYQYTARGTNKKDGRPQKDKGSRCMYIMTGEETPSNETSFIARLLLIYYPKQNITETRDHYLECVKMSKHYKEITPYFIKYVLSLDKESVLSRFKDIQQSFVFEEVVEGNDGRIAYNIALAILGWELFLSLSYNNGAITEDMMKNHLEDTRASSLKIQNMMLERCKEEKNSFIFVYRLKELLCSGVLSIQGFPPFDMGQVKIGFVEPDIDKNIAWLFPSILIDEIKKRTTTPLTLNQAAMASQLRTLKMLVAGSNSNTTQKRVGSSTLRMWKVDLTKMGLYIAPPSLVKDAVTQTTPTHEEGITLNRDGIA